MSPASDPGPARQMGNSSDGAPIPADFQNSLKELITLQREAQTSAFSMQRDQMAYMQLQKEETDAKIENAQQQISKSQN
jgi:hypothetical protein